MKNFIEKIKTYYNTDPKKFWIGVGSSVLAIGLIVWACKRKK